MRRRLYVCRPGATGADPGLLQWRRFAREFPTVALRACTDAEGVRVQASWWRSDTFDPRRFDEQVGDAAEGWPDALVLVDDGPPDLEQIALEMMTRGQGSLGRRNRHSAGPLFDAVLVRHRSLHDTSRALVRADLNHALDTWQWLLRLSADASLEAQIAALFHDVERLVSEAEVRVEQHAADYQAFKDAHAQGGARMTRECLGALGLGRLSIDRVCDLVARHERREEDDPDRALLNDADALSFFSLNSCGFIDYYGPEHTRRKIAYSLARMSPRARERLSQVRLRADVAAIVDDVAGHAPERDEQPDLSPRAGGGP